MSTPIKSDSEQISPTTTVPSKENPVATQERLRQLAKRHVIHQLAFHIHILTFLFVNILLGIINYLTSTSGYPWVLWVTISWLVALAYHYYAMKYGKRGGFAWHLFSYVIINSYLYFIYFFTSRGHYMWFFWPLGLWGIGILTHGIIHYMIAPKNYEDANKPWIDRKIDQELAKIFDDPQYRKLSCPKCGAIVQTYDHFCAQCGQELPEL